MLERARAGLEAAGLSLDGVQFVHADILEWPLPTREFDLVATHFVLDCFRPEQLEQVVDRLAGAATPDARWLLSDFREPSAGLGKWRARLILEAMYLFFGWTTGLPADRLTSPTRRWRGAVSSCANANYLTGECYTPICGSAAEVP